MVRTAWKSTQQWLEVKVSLETLESYLSNNRFCNTLIDENTWRFQWQRTLSPWSRSMIFIHLLIHNFFLIFLLLQWHDGFVETSFDVKVALIYVNLWVYVLLCVCIQSLSLNLYFSLSPRSTTVFIIAITFTIKELSRRMKAKTVLGLWLHHLFIDEVSISIWLITSLRCDESATFIIAYDSMERKFQWWSPYALNMPTTPNAFRNTS